MLPKGIIFDLDDTILQFDAIAKPVWISVCRQFADGVKIKDPSLLFDAIEKARKWYWSDSERNKRGRLNLNKARKTIVNKALDDLSISDENLADSIVEKYSIEREEKISFFPHAEETLEILNELNIKLILITNGQAHTQRAKVERFGLSRFFKAVFIEGEIGIGKPELKIFEKALMELNLNPEDVWSVGDNLEWDVDGPQKLGIYGIWNDYKNQGLPEDVSYKPDRIINNISELLK